MDIVERLRNNADERLAVWQVVKTMNEAADEIERLREALEAAKACINDKAYTAAVMIIDTALQQKDSE